MPSLPFDALGPPHHLPVTAPAILLLVVELTGVHGTTQPHGDEEVTAPSDAVLIGAAKGTQVEFLGLSLPSARLSC